MQLMHRLPSAALDLQEDGVRGQMEMMREENFRANLPSADRDAIFLKVEAAAAQARGRNSSNDALSCPHACTHTCPAHPHAAL
jgi:hypothetical protein